MSKPCYILSAGQVSCQEPLSDSWLTEPRRYESSFARAVEPDTKEYIVPSEARRMSRILKRAVCTSISTLNASGIAQPDAIITGTSMGCAENSERFLVDLSRYGEQCLKPTLFMQSTHNTISSLIAIILKCHGYNNTYSQSSISFESALFDAWLQIRRGSLANALVGAHDEMTPFMGLVAQQLYPATPFFSEASVSVMLSSSDPDKRAVAELVKVDLLHKPTPTSLVEACDLGPGAVLLTGSNGIEAHDAVYSRLLAGISPDVPVLQYKSIFGESFSSSALGFYAALRLLSNPVPEEMHMRGWLSQDVREIVCVNCSGGTEYGIVKIRKVQQ